MKKVKLRRQIKLVSKCAENSARAYDVMQSALQNYHHATQVYYKTLQSLELANDLLAKLKEDDVRSDH